MSGSKPKNFKNTLIQEFSGKLIEENHNGYDYSPEFTEKAKSWYLSIIYFKTKQYKNDHEKFGIFLKNHRKKFQDLLLHWPEKMEKDWIYNFFLDLLTIQLTNYYSGKEDIEILWNICHKLFTNLNL